jgi:peptide/nickel transport system substrate-binding protein
VDAELVRKNSVTFQGEAWLAEDKPSLERGTWVLNADGTMVTRYTMRPNIKWHDGTPFSTKDFAFGWEVIQDRRFPFGDKSVAQNITRVETPDDRTLVLYWSKIYNRADEVYNTRFRPMPRHILEDVYRNQGVDSLANSIWWTSGFVGSGPFKVASWDQDSQLVLEAFDDYFLGRPKVDRIIWKFIYDTNTMLSNVLTNNVDAALRQAFTLDTGLIARDQWQVKGEGTVIFAPVNIDRVGLSPLNPWLRDIRVRRAFLHAINRDDIVSTLSHNEEEVAHVPLSPGRPQYQQALAAATKYAYDPQRARQLLADAGWTPGPDGILVNSAGERFVIDGRADPQVFEVQLQTAIADYWKQVGIGVDIHNMSPREEAGSDQTRNHYAGAKWDWQSFAVELWRNFYGTSNIPTAENGWIGENQARWDDPNKEAVLDRMDRTFIQSERDAEVIEFSRMFSEQLPMLPIKLQAEVMSVRKSVQNIYPRKELGGENTRTWNAEQWDIS